MSNCKDFWHDDTSVSSKVYDQCPSCKENPPSKLQQESHTGANEALEEYSQSSGTITRDITKEFKAALKGEK